MASRKLVAASSTTIRMSVLAHGESYGYAIIARVRALSGGDLQWTEGMLYPVLHRLERKGWTARRGVPPTTGVSASTTGSPPRARANSPANEPKKTSVELKLDRKLTDLLRWAVEASEDDDGWANLGAVGAKIMSQQPDFDARSYGYGKLSSLVDATGLFEIERQTSQNGRVDILLRELPPPSPPRRR